MFFKLLILAVLGGFAYTFQGFDGEHAEFLAALPIVAAICFVALGPG